MNKAGTAYVDVDGKFDKLTDGLNKQTENMKTGFGKAFTGIAAAAAGAFAAVQIGGFLKGTIAEFAESERIGRLTNAVITSTGGAANVSAKQVDTLAQALAAKTGIDDEVIASGENVLMTFTNIKNLGGVGNDVFDQTTKAALDMSAALGTDVQGSVMLLGKALNDPVDGMSKLTRSGVTFTDAQKEQVKALTATGDILGAQKVILAEVSKEFGGAAEAAADPMKVLAVQFGNLKEGIGGALFPLIQQIAPVLMAVLPVIGDAVTQAIGPLVTVLGPLLASMGPILGTIATTIGGLITAIAPVIGVLGDVFVSLGPVFTSLGTTLVPLAAAIGGAVAAFLPLLTPVLTIIGGLVGQLATALTPIIVSLTPVIAEIATLLGGALMDAFTELAPAIGPLGETLGTVALAVGGALVSALKALAPALPALAHLVAVGANLIAAIPPEVLVLIVEAFLAFKVIAGIFGLVSAATTAFSTAFAFLNLVIAANPIVAIVIAIAALGAIVYIAYKKFEPFRNIIDAIGRLLRDVFIGALHAVQTVVGAVVGFISEHWKLLLAIITGPIGLIVLFVVTHFQQIKDAIMGAVNFIIDGIKAWIALFLGIWTGFSETLRSGWDALWAGISGALTAILDPLVRGLKLILNTVIGLINGAIDFINKNLQIHLDFEVPDFIPGLPDRISLNWDGPGIPKIPTLHSGGIFNAPFGRGEGLALLRDGELVSTPEQVAAGTRPTVQVGTILAWDAASAAAKLREELTFARLSGAF